MANDLLQKNIEDENDFTVVKFTKSKRIMRS